MAQGSTIALMAAAAAVGALHAFAPDHWMPFAALARSRGWTARHTMRVTLLCGAGHVTVSALLAIAALFAGLEIVQAFGSHLGANANALMMAFGTIYMLWGLRRSFTRDPLAVMHGRHHHHSHGRNDHDHGLTEWSLFALFSADPCVAVIPMVVTAAGGGWSAVAGVILVYEIATLSAMLAFVAAARLGAHAVRLGFIDRFGDAVAGALIVSVGATLAVLGV